MVREIYGRGNVRSGKCLSGEMSSRGSVLRGSVRLGNCPFGKMSVGEVSVGEVSVGELSLGKCQSGNCPHTVLLWILQKFLRTHILKNICSGSFYTCERLLLNFSCVEIEQAILNQWKLRNFNYNLVKEKFLLNWINAHVRKALRKCFMYIYT